jgi:O-antigen/teichoic acid export membrane protein
LSTSPTIVALPQSERVHQEESAQRDSGARRHLSVSESVVRGVVANVSAQPLTWAASLIGAVVVPRYLGAEGLGELAIAFSIAGFAAVALDLGIVAYLVRRIAQDPLRVRRDLGVALLMQGMTFSVGALLLAIVGPHLAPSLSDLRLLYLALFAMVVGSAQALFLTALRGLERHLHYAWLGAVPALGGATFCVLALVLGGDAFDYLAVGVAVDLAAALFTWRVSGLRPVWPAISWRLAREMYAFMRGGLPFLSAALATTVYGGIDRLMLGVMVPAAELGWYAAAYRIIGIPAFIPTVLVTALFPALSRSTHEPETIRRATAHALRMVLLLTVPLSLGICVVAPAIPTLFGWPADFGGAVPLMMILSLHLPVVAVDMVLGTVVMAIGRERVWLRVGIIAAVLNVGGNLVAIPFFDQLASNGSIGASIMTVATEVWMCIGAVLLIPKHLLDVRVLWQAVRIVLAGIAASTAAVALMPTLLPVAAIGGALTYAAMAVLLRVVSIEDVYFVKSRLSRSSYRETGRSPIA